MDETRTGEHANEVTVEITALSSRGAGIGRVAGKVVFVPLALPGETVRAGITRTHKDFDEAHLIEVITPSPHRVAPVCPMYPECHGCLLQHLSPVEQLPMKAEATGLGKWLERSSESTEIALHPAPSHVAYRTTARFHVDLSEPICIGFIGSRRVVPLTRCPMLSPPLNTLLAALSGLAADPSHAGLLRALRVSAIRAYAKHSVDSAAAVLYGEARDDDGTREALTRILDSIIASVPSFRGFSYVAGPSSAPIHLLESGFDDDWSGIPVRVNFGAFAQANPPVAAAIYQAAVEWVAPKPGDVGADLYCGTGAIAGLLASSGASVVGVESDPVALSHVEPTDVSSIDLHAPGAAFVLTTVPDALAALPPLDFIVANPPRIGFDRRTRALIAERRVSRLAIVSCDAATLRRDMAELLPAYRIERLAFYDMMPHTADVEILAALAARV